MTGTSSPLLRLALASLATAVPFAAIAQTVITVNVTGNRKAINPNIYGTAYATAAQLPDLNCPVNRYGGNNSSRYNWNLNADNRGSDWFFQSIADTSAVAGERGDTFFSTAKTAGAQALITIPMVPYIANLASGRNKLWSFSKAKYGNQTAYDSFNPDSGNGISTASGNPYITGNNPLDANVANSVATQTAWVNHLIATWGSSSAGGVKYYIMDNEPALWNSTHRDVHPAGETYDEILNLYKTYALAIRNADANAQIVGPEEWGWTGYFYSGSDAAWANTHGWGGPFPDKSAHGNMDHIPWLLQQLKAYQTSSGKQLLNVFSLHYYPQQGEFSNDDSAAMRTIRNRSTRSLWDPSYVDTSWINSNVQLIPRMKSWVSTYYPGLQTAITEYNWGDEAQLNGATAQADIFGIFGREGLDMATRWTTPATNCPTYLAMKIYRNYDGSKSTFGETSVSCTVPNPDNLSAFASQRTSDGATTVMVVNKLGSSAPIRIDLSNFTPSGTATVWQISSATQTSINHLANATLSGNSLSATVPAQSVTLYVIAKSTASGPQYDFESNTQGWTSSGVPVASVSWSTTQHFAGTHSLAVNINGAAGTGNAFVGGPTVAAGSTVTFHVWIPATSSITSIQPYVQQGASGGWTWSGTWKDISTLTKGGWNTITVAVPANAVNPMYQLGCQFTTNATSTTTCYIDAVSW
ncbi:glycoside hydrolase family 44 protein [Fimbriimonas ginsengisoli]|uniref:Cellulase n=1 Tax=Fimbriimonas ginsengisoli Gsoil 348 TaxID=661478 RepID=A0A068NU10_FIMGI|nr:glycoside hydrolase family 44 protein [Fimbriimonas ginsengisoli]AIE86931.1 cellulase [Fimbriimonas ginsengisoli Gsoil 348]